MTTAIEVKTNNQSAGKSRIMTSDDNFLSELLDTLDGTLQIPLVQPEDDVEDDDQFLGILGDETGRRVWQLVQEYKRRQFLATQRLFPQQVKTFASCRIEGDFV